MQHAMHLVVRKGGDIPGSSHAFVGGCYGFEYSKDNPKNIDSQQVPSFQGSRFKDSENSLVKEFVSRIKPMF